MDIYSRPFITELIEISVIWQNSDEVSKATANFHLSKVGDIQCWAR